MAMADLHPALTQARALRDRLWPLAELSGAEAATAAALADFLTDLRPDALITGLGGHGLLAEFSGRAPGPTLLWRAELDAVPGPDGAPAHLCGHDGHLAVLGGLAAHLATHPPARGRVLVACQPAEENGQGAAAFLADPRLAGLVVDLALAFHNLPGWPLGQVVARTGAMNCASVGLAARLEGRASHAAQPERGRSPAPALARLLLELPDLPARVEGFSLVTIVHARLGQPAFGVSPGDAQIMATLRADRDSDLEALLAAATSAVAATAQDQGLDHALSLHDRFPATVNHPAAIELARRACVRIGLDWREAALPFRWSEDFGAFCKKWPGALLVLGAGRQHPPLHNPGYRFPADLLEPGLRLAAACAAELLGD